MATSAASSSGVCSSATVAVVPSIVVICDVDQVAGPQDILRRFLVGPAHPGARHLGGEGADAHAGAGVVDAAHHRRHDVAFADVARPAVELESVDGLALREDIAAWLAEAAALVDAAQSLVDRLVRRLLQPDVECGLHREAALVQRLGAVLRLEMLAHLFEEVGRHAAFAGRVAGDQHRLVLGHRSGLARDEALDGHPLERVVAAAQGRLGIDERTLPDVALDDAGQGRALLEVEVLRGLAEIELRGRLDAVGAVTEINLIAIEREDLFFGVALLDPNRDQRFLDLALPAAIADRETDLGREDVAGQLLGDGAAARRASPRRDIANQREHHARNAEPGVLEEPRVLRGEDRLAKIRGDVVVVNDHAALDRELADQLPVLSEHPRNGVGGVVVERADFGQVVGVGKHHPAQRAEQGGRDKQGGNAGMAGVADGNFHLDD